MKYIKSKNTITGIYALLDPVILSLTNLVIILSFIKYSPKEDYATYVLLFTPIILAQGVQNSLLNSPFTTVYNQAHLYIKNKLENIVLIMHVWLGMLFFLLTFLVAMLFKFTIYDAIKWSEVIGVSVATLGVFFREGVRAFFYTKKNVKSAFLGDSLYSISMLFIMAAFIFEDKVSPGNVLLSMGLFGIFSSFIQMYPKKLTAFNNSYNKRLLVVWHRFWQYGKWALSSVTLTWVNLNSYPYVVLFFFGATTVADIAASRFFWMPMTLIITAWSSVFRPYISSWFSNGKTQLTKRLTFFSIILSIFLFLIYGVLLYLSYPFIHQYLLGEAYNNTSILVIFWGVFFFTQCIRSLFMSSLMVSERGYKVLSKISFISLIVYIASIPLFFILSEEWIIIMLTIVELIQLTLILSNLSVYWVTEKDKNKFII